MDKNTDELRIQDLAGIVGSVFQDPRSQFFATDTTAEIAFSCENVGLPREELCYRIERAANDLQITRLLERSIFELSSGEKQSIAIASVYALSPKILVLDEPSANLDSVATQHLMKILDSLKKQGYTIVISEHRVHYLKDIADRAILIENGKMKKKKFVERIFAIFLTKKQMQWDYAVSICYRFLPAVLTITREKIKLN